MSVKSTLALMVLVAGIGGLFYWGPEGAAQLKLASPPPVISDAGTRNALTQITPQSLRRIEIASPNGPVILVSADGKTWSMPGGWPVRQRELADLLDVLGSLQSRFAALPIGDDPSEYGLSPKQNPVKVSLETDAGKYAMNFGDGSESGFTRSTYLQLGDRPEVVRLGPGILPILRRGKEFYQRKQLVPSSVRVRFSGSPPLMPGNDESSNTVAILDAEEILTENNGAKVLLRRTAALPKPETGSVINASAEQVAESWELREPVRDQVDPDRLRSILAAVPQLWVESFVTTPKSLTELGLEKPSQTLTIKRAGASPLTLLIGNQSQVKTRKSTAPPPPPPSPFAPPPPPMPSDIKEEYRFAKLQDNPQIFEIKYTGLDSLFLPVADLRDAKVTRFSPNAVTALEIAEGGKKLAFVKEVDEQKVTTWKLTAPFAAIAETARITELLDKLTALQARDANVVDQPDSKKLGLEPASAVLTVTIEEETPGDGDNRPKRKRTLGIELGKPDAMTKKLPVRQQGAVRVSLVEDSLTELVQRPALAYRGKRLFDFSGTAVEGLIIQSEKEKIIFNLTDGNWKASSPAAFVADKTALTKLAGDLAFAEVTEYVNESAENLTEYGLDRPALSVEIRASGPNRKPVVLQIGKARPGDKDYFAKLADSKTIFALKAELQSALAASSLSYRPLQPWTLTADDLTSVRVSPKGNKPYALKREADRWQTSGEVETAAAANRVQPLLEAIARFKITEYKTHDGKPNEFGLDQPALTLEFTAEPKSNDNDKPIARTLRIGNELPENKGRFAAFDGDPAVFVIPSALLQIVPNDVLAYLERKILSIPAGDLAIRLERKGEGGEIVLSRDKPLDSWQVSGPQMFTVDANSVATVLGQLASLEASEFAAYGKPNWSEYGLDDSAVRLVLTTRQGEGEGAKTATTVVLLGKPHPKGGRYARIGDSPAVAVLSSEVATSLARGPLGYADRKLLQFRPDDLVRLIRKVGGELEIVKADEAWTIQKPARTSGDKPSIEDLADSLGFLSAVEVKAFRPASLADYGLDSPAAVWQLTVGADKKQEFTLKIGKIADESTGDRFVQVDGSPMVGTIAASLAKRLLAGPLQFRDRSIGKPADADRATLERGDRRATFTRTDGVWALTEPVKAPAESVELANLVKSLANLRADELVEEKPKASRLKEFGLDKPTLKWTLSFSGADQRTLEVGGPEKSANPVTPLPRYYARLTGGEMVFLLDPQLSERVLAEYRPRNLLPNLDAASVESLIFSGPSGEGNFVFLKQGGMWRHKDQVLDTAAVNDTLAVLAGLKVRRYAVDDKADARLYGLEPARWTIITNGRGGTTTLELGTPVAGEEGVYARLAGAKTVVILSEADVKKLMRKVIDYLPKKP